MATTHSDPSSSGAEESGELKRSLSGPMLAVYGAGTILGAGIYVLIGKIAGHAGYWTPLAFLLAALIAGINGLAYAELSTRRPNAGGPSDYVDHAFSKSWLAIAIGWMIVITGVVSAATITTGFAGYLLHFIDIPEWLPAIALLGILGTVAALGAKESAWFMAITTSLGVLGLGYVMWVGFTAGEGSGAGGDYLSQLPSLVDTGVLAALLTATFLAVYSFIGFEDMVHMAEEVKKPSRAMPGAIVTAIVVAAAFYVVVSFAALRVATPDELGRSEAPLVDVVEKADYPGWPLALLSLWIILNGALAQIIMSTRVIYSLEDRGGAPGWLARVNERTSTPVIATAATTLVALCFAFFLPLETLASITSLVMLLVFAASNAALIRLDRRNTDPPFDVPDWLPWVGLALCLLLIIGRFFVDGGSH